MGGCFNNVQLFATQWTVACQASLSMGFSRQEYWNGLPYPSRALYFQLPYPPTPLSNWCCQMPCNSSSCTTSTTGPHGANPSPPGQPQEQTLVDDPHAEVAIKPQLKHRGSVAKEEDPKLSHQLYKLQIKFPQSTRQTPCLWNILKDFESSHKGKHTSSDSCGHWKQEHTGIGPD